ncbi:aminotransferase class I/II-fold pyridoxal phosphate-dependent enzyme [Bordetella bronchiseptica]|uniref:Serine hydroxymethyltransferase-like domain-containing protein n=1 Tax=Bordetella genomosp. 6 TaxID=463024 RepID=A0ABX4FDW4_9BORD|nr:MULTISPECIES: aminotransferase class I/II-fold pyridoxal phosphate-dependent enzyme [Bordetella]MBN3267015.1 glycine hydroxymethyltransferase [Bordetella bronchiseptica]OZI80399.1 hypothetical protein CAL23_01310 [Bordetella genomosp. 6]
MSAAGETGMARIEALAAGFSERMAHGAMVLYAGMNLPSPRAAALLGLPLGAMPAMGQGAVREQPGVQDIVELENVAEQAACRVFQGGWAEVRLQSGTLANLAVYAAACRPGDLIAITPRRAGGHVSHQERGAPSILGLRTVELPFLDAQQCLDDAASAALIRRERPRLVMLGASYVPRAFDFPAIAQAAREAGALLAYDIAHVAGLVAGGAFPNPLAAGADLLTASTYKSLAGPPGGLIVGRADAAPWQARVREAVFPRMTANYDAARVAALGVSLLECERHAAGYARAMLSNARALAAALRERGLPVLPTQTHHLAIPLADADARSHELARAGIVCGAISVAGQHAPRALRLGTQLLTRRGFETADMAQVADLLARALSGDAPADALRAEVAAFMQRRATLAYC